MNGKVLLWGAAALVLWVGVLASFLAAVGVAETTFRAADFPTGGEAWFNFAIGALMASGATAAARNAASK